MWNVFQILDGHRGHVTTTLLPYWENIPPRIVFLCKYSYLGPQHSYAENILTYILWIYCFCKYSCQQIHSQLSSQRGVNAAWSKTIFFFKWIVLEKFSRNTLSSWRDIGNRMLDNQEEQGEEQKETNCMREPEARLRQALKTTRTNLSWIGNQGGCLRITWTLIPDTCEGESPVHLGEPPHKKIQQPNLEEQRHFQGRRPGCGVEGWGLQLLRNRDRRYGRRRIKNEEICQYSSRKEVNHRWELSEMGKSNTAQNFKVKLENLQDLCGFRLKGCKTTCTGHVSLKGWSRKLFNSELSFGFFIKPQTKKTVLRVGVGSYVSLRKFLLPVNDVREWKITLCCLWAFFWIGFPLTQSFFTWKLPLLLSPPVMKHFFLCPYPPAMCWEAQVTTQIVLVFVQIMSAGCILLFLDSLALSH